MPYTTYQDLLEHAAGYGGKDASVTGSSHVRRAVQAAIEDLSSMHEWSYYKSIGRITTVATYNTGTIAFDLTGGANERMLTLTGGTWPTWAAFGLVQIGDKVYTADERISDTILTLRDGNSPSADVASGTAFSIFRDTYPLPDDFRSCGDMVALANGGLIMYRSPQSFIEQRRVYTGTGRMSQFTIATGQLVDGKLAATFYPPPDIEYTLEFAYMRSPPAPVLDEVSDGTASATAAGTTVTGTSTSFTSRHVGAIIRLGYNAKDKPTGLDGINPYSVERRVLSVESPTSLTVEGAFAETATRVRYTLSSPVDIERGAMRVLLTRLVEKSLRQGSRLEAVSGEPSELARAIAAAKEADSRYYGRQGVFVRRAYRNINDYPVVDDE